MHWRACLQNGRPGSWQARSVHGVADGDDESPTLATLEAQVSRVLGAEDLIDVGATNLPEQAKSFTVDEV